MANKQGPCSKTTFMVACMIIRFVMVALGEYMDRVSDVKYTDTDYSVFSDAATHVYNG